MKWPAPVIPTFTDDYTQLFNEFTFTLYDVVFYALNILLYIEFYVCF